MFKEKKLKPNKDYVLISIITFIGIFIDQISKFFIRNEFSNLSVVTGNKYYGFKIISNKGIEIIKDFFYIFNVKNTGGAWGIFSGNVMILSIISFLVVISLIFFLKNEKKITKLSAVYYGILFSGIIGNLIDRIFFGYVTDFFNFYIFGYDYPVFNIADILIVFGIILMMIDVVRGEIYAYQERKRKSKN